MNQAHDQQGHMMAANKGGSFSSRAAFQTTNSQGLFPQKAWSNASVSEESQQRWGAFGRNNHNKNNNSSNSFPNSPTTIRKVASENGSQTADLGTFLSVDDMVQASIDSSSSSSLHSALATRARSSGALGGHPHHQQQQQVGDPMMMQQKMSMNQAAAFYSQANSPSSKITRSVTAHKSISELNALLNPNLYPDGRLPASALNLIPLLNAATGGGGVAGSQPEYSQQSSQTAAELVARSQSEIISGSNNYNGNGNRPQLASSNSLDSLPSPRSLRGENNNSNSTLRCVPVTNNSQTSMHSLYKTELCRSWEETGCCRYGNKCQFAHGKNELRPIARHPKYKTEICRTFATSGTCPYGTRCRFIHYISPKVDSSSGSAQQQRSSTPPMAPATPNVLTLARSGGGDNGAGHHNINVTEENIESSNADTWTELLDMYNETNNKAANPNSSSKGGKVKRTKSAYPRLESENNNSLPSTQSIKRLPIFQSLSFKESN
jgi:butyrate response factor 1